jgi:hypothetical protein
MRRKETEVLGATRAVTTWTFHTISDRVVGRCCAALRERVDITVGWSAPGGSMRVRGQIVAVKRGRGVPDGQDGTRPSWDITIEGAPV